MKKYIREIMLSENNGLYLCELPTGYGKTYNVVQAIRDYVKELDDDRKIIYLTTLNKNLPEDELLKAFGNDKKEYNKRVLRIRSNFDEVTEKLENLIIPEKFKTGTYEELLKVVEKYNGLIRKKAQDQEYIKVEKENINKAEYQFRKELVKWLNNSFANKKEKLEAIHSDPNWKWIGQLYPAVFTDEHQILLMSVSKFMKRNSSLVEPSYEFLKSDILKNAIIFIDEFDATKDTSRKIMIEEALSVREEYLDLFRHILRGLNPDYFSTTMINAYKSIEGHILSEYTFDEICKEAHEIEKKYSINLSYKMVGENIDRRQNFLLKDATYHTIVHNENEYIRAVKNEKENRVDIFFDASKEVVSENVNGFYIYELLREINSFMIHFRILLYAWARSYRKEINNRRRIDEDEFTLENAIHSILEKIGISADGREIIFHKMMSSFMKRNQDELLLDNSFYQTGMEIFEFEDHDSHYDATKLRLVSVSDTPEKMLTYLSKKATVIGISATAELPSVVGNYNLDYLKNKLDQQYYPTPEIEKSKIKQELSKTWNAYKDGQVKVHTEIVKNKLINVDVRKICESIFYESDYAMICANYIQNMIGEEYYQLRYCNIALAMHRFFEKKISSMLYLGMALPRGNYPELDEELLRKIFNLVEKDCKVDDVSDFVILRSHSFDEHKEKLICRLGNGEKIFVMSSYQTLGAGQNLQYKAPDKSVLIELTPYKNNGDQRHFYKDIDAIYLGDITHLTANTYFRQQLTEEELLGMLFQIEELMENSEISFAEGERMMKLAFRSFANCEHCERNILYKTESVKLQATRHVMQAVGRMCRTYLKAKDIYIFIEEQLLEKLSAGEMKKHILSPEMQELVKCREKLGAEYTDEQVRILKKAEKVSTYGMWKIRQVLSRNWTDSSMRLWNNLRKITLRYPTISSKEVQEDKLLKELYITSGTIQNQYFYSQYSDFKDVTIEFGVEEVAFRNSGRAKCKAGSGEVLVYKMSEAESGLPSIMQYPGMKEFFKEKGYATSFEKNEYMMSPVLFHNIYKGALGEVAGQFILKKELGIELKEIKDPERFEFFDFEMAENVYVDFKNWKFSYLQDRESIKREILKKLDKIGGKRVYIINIIGEEDVYVPTVQIDRRMIEIPCLINARGKAAGKCMKMIQEEDFR